MRKCQKCATEVLPNAKFCHRCGEKHAEQHKNCPSCQQSNPLVSVFCHHCGFHFEGKKHREQVYQPKFPLDFDPETLTEQVKALFFRGLRQRVADEQDVARYSDYVDRFYHSDFRKIYTIRADQIAEDALINWERRGAAALPKIDNRIGESFEGLMDYFFIRHCQDLNKIRLPETILKYERVGADTDQWQMMQDFLDFDREPEVFDFDFLQMEPERLANACRNFLTAERRERVFFICDLSLKGSCKDGFALTDRAIYWRAPFDRPRRVAFQEISEVIKAKDWLTINGFFFTANPSLNLKLFKLLKKLWAVSKVKEEVLAEVW